MTPAGAGSPAYVAAVLTLYLDLPDTPLRPNPVDQSLATLRRLSRPADLPPLPKIRSLAYFLPVIAEMQQQPLPDGYLDYLRLKLRKLAQD